VRGETFRASRGGGSALDGAAIRVAGRGGLGRALVATGFGYDLARRSTHAELLLRVLPAVRGIRVQGAAALDLAWVAAGRLDGYYERGIGRWDWAAGRLLVTEAGGAVRDLDGQPHGVVAASPALLPELAELVGST
jgi:myo-inositol-1(or 4)-monophosphatase